MLTLIFHFILYRYVPKNLRPGEAVIVIDYKMKLELGMHSREIQRDWCGKRGVTLHGFYVIAQVSKNKRQIEVNDLWSEDTKQYAWFTCSVSSTTLLYNTLVQHSG